MTCARDPKKLTLEALWQEAFGGIWRRHHEGGIMQEASGGSIWRRHHRRRHLRYLEGIWKHLDTSGGIWEASGDMDAFGRHLEASGRHLGSI
jgi:hypothetical protein